MEYDGGGVYGMECLVGFDISVDRISIHLISVTVHSCIYGG